MRYGSRSTPVYRIRARLYESYNLRHVERVLTSRSFIRRIIVGSALDGDRVIYQKAEVLETNYRKRYRLDNIEDGDDIESDDSILLASPRNRRHRSEPARYSVLRRQKIGNPFNSIKFSDFESDVSTQSTHYANRRYRSQPARNSALSIRKGKAPVKTDDSTAKIRKLEQEIRRLKMHRSMSPRDRREA
ncbi:hypothetical protein N7467_002720 [Penicillium canescens]|nr:hypothetical protein N7467_002720 [Penicillium canescens]